MPLNTLKYNIEFFKKNNAALLCIFAGTALYYVFAYHLMRSESLKLIGLYTALFFCFFKILNGFKHKFKVLVAVSILFRLIFLFAIPNLSQDFYRFIWDGRLLFTGLNPYLFTPDSLINKAGFSIDQARELYNGMGALSASHYTNYPPIKQVLFGIAALFSGKSIMGAVIVFRLFIIAADIGTLYLGKKILEHLKLPIWYIFLYILNPFIIIELTGNLHFEGIMIFFLVLSFYVLLKGKWHIAAVIFAASISVKLIPLLLLPLFFNYFISQNNHIKNSRSSGFKRLIGFYAIVGITTLLLFLPFFSLQFIDNYTATVGLWFSNFEFNASLYYVARQMGFWISGYNQIAVIGKAISVITIFTLMLLALFRRNLSFKELLTTMLFGLSIYYFVATTVHPWYLATLLILSIFTTYRFPLVWSFMVILSYVAYNNSENQENLWLVFIEYCVVYAVFIWEVFIKKKTSNWRS